MPSEQIRVAPEFKNFLKQLNEKLKAEFDVDFKGPQLTKIVARKMQNPTGRVVIKVVKRKRRSRIL